MASENGHIDVVRLLLADGRVNPAASDNYAIRLASENGRTDVVRLLLADGRVDPAAKDNYAIREASCYGHVDVVRLLLADVRKANVKRPVRWRLGGRNSGERGCAVGCSGRYCLG